MLSSSNLQDFALLCAMGQDRNDNAIMSSAVNILSSLNKSSDSLMILELIIKRLFGPVFDREAACAVGLLLIKDQMGKCTRNETALLRAYITQRERGAGSSVVDGELQLEADALTSTDVVVKGRITALTRSSDLAAKIRQTYGSMYAEIYNFGIKSRLGGSQGQGPAAMQNRVQSVPEATTGPVVTSTFQDVNTSWDDILRGQQKRQPTARNANDERFFQIVSAQDERIRMAPERRSQAMTDGTWSVSTRKSTMEKPINNVNVRHDINNAFQKLAKEESREAGPLTQPTNLQYTATKGSARQVEMPIGGFVRQVETPATGYERPSRNEMQYANNQGPRTQAPVTSWQNTSLQNPDLNNPNRGVTSREVEESAFGGAINPAAPTQWNEMRNNTLHSKMPKKNTSAIIQGLVDEHHGDGTDWINNNHTPFELLMAVTEVPGHVTGFASAFKQAFQVYYANTKDIPLKELDTNPTYRVFVKEHEAMLPGCDTSNTRHAMIALCLRYLDWTLDSRHGPSGDNHLGFMPGFAYLKQSGISLPVDSDKILAVGPEFFGTLVEHGGIFGPLGIDKKWAHHPNATKQQFGEALGVFTKVSRGWFSNDSENVNAMSIAYSGGMNRECKATFTQYPMLADVVQAHVIKATIESVEAKGTSKLSAIDAYKNKMKMIEASKRNFMQNLE